jgi:predicted hydrolase (HD superfamily)
VAVKSSKPHIITPLEAPALLQELEPDHSFIERQYTVAAKQIGWLMREFGPDESWPTNGVSHPVGLWLLRLSQRLYCVA